MSELHRLRRRVRLLCVLCLALFGGVCWAWLAAGDVARRSETSSAGPVVDDLRQQLALAGHAERIRLLHRLGRAGTDRATSAIVQTLREARSDRVRRAAIAQLARIGTPAAVAELFDAAGARRPAVRRAAVAALGQIGSAEAVDRLVELLDDTQTRSAAIRALGRAGGEVAAGALVELAGDEDEPQRLLAIAALGQSGGEVALQTLSVLCRSGQAPQLRAAAVAALGELGLPQARRALIALAEDRDPRVERAALQALAGYGDDQVRALLARKARDGVAETAITALRALGEGEAIAPELLHGALTSADWRRRQAAVQALGRAGTEEARDQLLALVSGNDEMVAASAAWELAQSEDPAARAALLAAVSADGSPAARARLVAPLAQLGGPEVDETLRRLAAEGGQPGAAALSALANRGGPDAKRTLIEAYREGSQQVRWAALQGLSELAGPAERQLLLEAAHSGNYSEARMAVQALGRIDGPQRREVLERLLDEGSSSARAEAARQLAARGDDETRSLLIERLKQGKDEVTWALGEMNDPQTQRELARILDDPSLGSGVKQAALSALSRSGDPAQLLRAARHTDPAIASQALQQLGNHGGAETERVLREALLGDDPSRKQAALSALAQQQTPGALSAVGRALDEPATFDQAAQILGQTGGKQAVGLLAERYHSGSTAQRQSIVNALANSPGPQGRRLLDRALDDPDEQVAATAAAVLARSCGLQHKTRLLALMQSSPSLQVRRAIAQQLRHSDSGLYRRYKQLIEAALNQGS